LLGHCRFGFDRRSRFAYSRGRFGSGFVRLLHRGLLDRLLLGPRHGGLDGGAFFGDLGHLESKRSLDFDCDVFVDRAGVGLFLLDAELRQEFQYPVGLYFELTRQLVDPDLLHKKSTAPPRTNGQA
jgi:hypothetical protein